MIHEDTRSDTKELLGVGPDLLWKDEVYAIIGAAMEVHSELGHGFLEPVYQEAMEMELAQRGVPYRPQCALVIYYKGRPLQKQYVADLICFDEIVVELKAMEKLTSREEGQLLNYLKATGKRVGLLINFGSTGKLEWKRMVL
jgi:GxxExxY protein